MSYRFEQQLRKPVSKYLKKRDFDIQHTEMPFYEYRIDLYAYSADQDQTIAIELKLDKWSRAIEQALLYQLCSDLVYIAMPASKAIKINKSALKQHGLGLLSVSARGCEEIISPNQSTVTRKHYRQAYLEVLNEGTRNAIKHS